MRSLIPALALLLSAFPAVAQADGNAAVRDAVHAFEEAQRHGDRAALDRLLAPDFLFVRGSGRIGNREDFMAGFAGPGVRIDALEIADPLLLRGSADAAVAGGEGRIRGSEGGRPFANHFRYSDMLIRRGDRWMILYAQVTGLPD